MAEITRERLTDTPFENTVVEKIFVGAVHKQYGIKPKEGYKLHDTRADEEIIDMESGEPTGEIKKGYRKNKVTVSANYDFNENPNEFYAVKDVV